MASFISKIAYLILAVCTISTHSHTWVTCVNQQGSTCQGYIRNYRGRTGLPNNDVDNFYTQKALGRPSNFQLCKPDTQSSRLYTDQYPMAKVNAGGSVNIMYTPNGHSQVGDWGLRTTSRIHWTGSTNTNNDLKTRADLNAANLLTSWPYGQNCATSGDIASLPCTNALQIPANTPSGVYSFVWYWPYDSNQQQVPIGEEYYSCFDVNVTGTAVAPTTQNPTPTTQSPNPTTTQTVAPTTQNPTTQAPSSSDICGSYLTECTKFCGSTPATVCECDPLSGKKTVRCGDQVDALTSNGLRMMAGLSAILALAQLL